MLSLGEHSVFEKGVSMIPHKPPMSVLDLAMAVIASSTTPLVLLDADLNVIAASLSFCDAFQLSPATIAGHPLAELGAGEWNVPQLSSLLTATASGHAEVAGYEMDLVRPGRENRRLVLDAHKLDYSDGKASAVRLLLAASDVTDARAAESVKDELLQEKGVLLKELQHRIGNSLQIIASVLMQSARNTQSEETRGHLHEAHQRVMSVAAMQSQLAASDVGDVELRPYFTALCKSIGASMIHDHDQLSLAVSVDDCVTSSNASVSLGLIVTELVINALKHAFPKGRHGKINVDYHTDATTWILSVKDDGVGMPADVATTKAGLGTSIVRALTQQLHAEIEIADARPGTMVRISHAVAIAGVAEGMPTARAV
jgi:two-component system, sensor histidine kinase PdtaS